MQPPTSPEPQQPQQHQWKPVTDTAALRELAGWWGRGLRALGPDIWQVGIREGGRKAWRDLHVVLRQPPRWFWVALAVALPLSACAVALSLTNYLLYHAH